MNYLEIIFPFNLIDFISICGELMTVNKKHVLFIGFLFILMISIQGVMAVDLESTEGPISEISDSINCENDVASIQIDDANNDVNSEMDQSSVSDSDDLEETFANNDQAGDIKKSPLKALAAGEPGSFTELQALINENAYGTLSLDKDYSYFSGDSAIQISNPIVINGNGFTLDGGNQVRIFSILAQDVVLNDLIFVNGNNTSGGAIRVDAQYCTISNSHFEKNDAYYGGAVYVKGHGCIINNTEFKDNEAYLRGGALYMSDVIVTVENSNFTSNHVQVIGSGGIGGGAIFVAAINGSLVNCTFKGNNASEGGAVYGGFGRGIINSTFEDNHAIYQDGGALYLSLQNGSSVMDCTFIDNDAQGQGGAIYVAKYNSTISGSRFENSYAYSNGGAVYLDADGSVIVESTFVNNEAEFNGGAVYIASDKNNLTDSTFIENTAGNGGSVYMNGMDNVIDESIFERNYCDKGSAVCMDNYYEYGSNAYNNQIINSSFVNNTGEKGAVYVISKGNSIRESKFIENKNEGSNGGAVYWEGEDGAIFDSEFSRNSAFDYGGAIYWSGENGIVKNSDFHENDAWMAGAVCWSGDNGQVSDCSFNANKASYGGDGGAICWDGNLGEVENSRFESNSAEGNAGAVLWNGVKGTIDGCDFIQNHASNAGAAIINGENCIIIDSIFEKNSADSDAGAVKVQSGYVKVETSNFYDNEVSYGGALYWSGENGVLNQSSFDDNKAQVIGGAVCWYGNNGIINATEFNRDESPYAGALHVGSSNVQVLESSFYDNYATEQGGALKWDGSSGFISDCKFYYNAAGNGGAAKIDGYGFELQDSEFYYNGAGDNGGAIYFSGNDGIINNVVFDTNSANSEASQGEGGALYVYGYNLLVDNSTFRKNSAWNDEGNAEGGAIRIMGDYAKVMNSIFEENYADTHGGAINWVGSYGVLYNSTFDGNTVYTIGGAVYWSGCDASIDKSRFWNNNVSYYTGGAVAFETNGYINNSEFINNTAHKGGGLYVIAYGDFILNNSYFRDNYAIYAGAGVSCDYFYADNVKIIDSCKFENNEAHNYGGAIASLDTEIRNSQFIANKAHMGGAIHTFESKIVDSSFSSNKADYGNDLYCYRKNVIYTDGGSNGKMSSFKYDGMDILGAVSPLLAVSNDEKLVSSNIEQVPGELIEIVSEIGNSTRMTNIGYVAICVERNTYFPKYGTKDDTLRNLINYKTGEYIGDYLKILVYTHFNSTDDIYPHEGDNYGKPRPDYYSTAVHVFSDGDFRNSDNPLVVEVLKLYDSGFRVPNQAYKHVANNTYLRYNFSSMVSPASQSLFIFNIDTVKRNETEDDNETNKTKPPVNETVPPEPSEPPEKPVVHPPVEKKIPHVPVSSEATGNPLFLLILAIMMSFTQFKPKK